MSGDYIVLMNVKNCSRCGKIFTHSYGPVICKECSDYEENDYQKIKEYVWNNPKCSTVEVAEACNIPVKKLLTWIREGRLQVADDSPLKLRCEKCGIIISSGYLCEKCALDERMALKNSLKEENAAKIKGTTRIPTRDEKVRFLNNKL